MNVKKFNEQFKCILADPNPAVAKARNKLGSAPLIDWADDDSYWHQDSFPDLFEGKIIRLPFDSFRVSGKYNGGNFQAIVSYFDSADNKIKRAGIVVWLNTEYLPSKNHLFYYERWFTKDFLPGKDLVNVGFADKRTGVLEAPTVYTKDPQKQQDLFHLLGWEWVLKLSIDFQNPHFHLCKKCPPLPQGKSIIWQEQRTHYVLLHKSHPANSKAAGKVVQSEPQILRMAHSRRAHFRLLSSPNFKNKQGQRVWVKSSWVGPKEWQDQGGQIYKIVERNP